MPVDNSPKKPKLVQPGGSNARRVYWLNNIRTKREDGSLVELKPTPEQMAVAIAKCSRSDTPFDQNIDDVSIEKAADFHEKWVVGYGHASVAEHSIASVAFQNIPLTIVKILEDSRLASFTEKSTRYQVFSRERAGVPQTLSQSQFSNRVADLFDRLYGLYNECNDLLQPIMEERCQQDDLTPIVKKAVVKAMVCDITRYLLPAASLTSMGMTANARVWERTIVKLLSSNDPLAKQIGEELRSVLRGFENLDRDEALKHFAFPTLLKYADHNPYLAGISDKFTAIAEKVVNENEFHDRSDKPVICTFDDHLAERRIAASLLSRYAKISMHQALDVVAKDAKLEEKLLRTALEDRGAHDQPIRELEHSFFEHDIVTDYGAWIDIQRHRLCTQSNQVLGTNLGYDMPEEFAEIGKDKEFIEVMEMARALNQDILQAGMEAEAEYVVPKAFRRRVLISWNMRELFHFVELRSGKKGHSSYRKIAQDVWRTINESHPLIASYMRVDLSETSISTLGFKPKGL
ncbi:FAD-dependent thymidylate synthase [Patescibacteria group bacterium]|nr:FAD-dependent thymidylate synthase [Patescibacteria group bacterium]